MKRDLKILFLIDSLGQGGSERSIVELLPYLSQSRIKALIVCLYPQLEGFQEEVQELGFEVRFLGQGWPRRFRELRHIIKMEKPDLVHTTLFASDVLGRLASLGLSIPVLTSLVNTSYHRVRLQDPNIRRTRLYLVKKIDSWTARYCTNHFHAVSQTVKEAAMNDLRIKAERITVVYRGRDQKRLVEPNTERLERIRSKLGLKMADEVLVCVGRQEYQKGHPYLLKAMEQLVNRRKRLVLLLVGRPGAASAEIARLQTAAHLNGAVKLLGYRNDVADILAAADIFVFPSLYEGLPGAIIEAMALGLPIVASDIPSIREMIEPGRNALLVPAANAELLAQATESLLNDRNKASQFGRRSREIFNERFTMSRAASQMIELYQNVIPKTESVAK